MVDRIFGLQNDYEVIDVLFYNSHFDELGPSGFVNELIKIGERIEQWIGSVDG